MWQMRRPTGSAIGQLDAFFAKCLAIRTKMRNRTTGIGGELFSPALRFVRFVLSKAKTKAKSRKTKMASLLGSLGPIEAETIHFFSVKRALCGQ
jgi:hypothetical protein